MQYLSLAHLFSQLASLICTLAATCFFVTLLALCMQQPFFQKSRWIRAALGIVISAAMLVTAPTVYRRPRQHMAIGLATNTYMAALTMLDWCLLQTTVPSVQALLSSVVWQPMSGIISAYNAKLNSQTALQHQCAPSSAQQAAAITAESASTSKVLLEQQQQQQQQQQLQQTTSQLVFGTVSALVRLMVLMDIVSAILQCGFCYGSLPSLQRAPTGSSLGIAAAFTLHRYLFKGVAGFLLGMQLAATYMMGRITLLLFGYKDLGPINIFDKPWTATSISDLWSNRWHQVLRFYFTGLGYSLADWLSAVLVQLISGFGGFGALGLRTASSGVKQGRSGSSTSSRSSKSTSRKVSQKDKGSTAGDALDNGSNEPTQHLSIWQRETKKAVRTLVVFAMSGLVHEYVLWAAFGIVSGKQLAFFMLHGFAVLAEGLGSKLFKRCGWPGVPMWLGRVWVFGFALLTCPLFVDVLLEHKHYQNYVPPFVVPYTAVLLEMSGLCKCS